MEETLFIRSKACFHLLARDYPLLFEIENTTSTRAGYSDFSLFIIILFFFYFLSNPGRENGIAVILDSLNVNPDYESRGGQHTGGAWEWNNKKRRKANMEISRKLQFPSGSSLVQFLLVSIVHLI